MKDYLKCPLTEDEKKLIKGIIWMTAKSYKQKKYQKVTKRPLCIDELELCSEDEYEYVSSDTIVFPSPLRAYTKNEKQKIVDYIDSILDELSLNKFRRALTFEEKLVLFLYDVQKYMDKDIIVLLGISKRTIANRKKEIKDKKKKFRGGI